MARFFIVGASSLIAQSAIEILKTYGHEIVSCARNNEKISPDIILDATDFDALEVAMRESGPFDGALNCAGSIVLKPAHHTDFNQYMAVINANLTSAFALVRAAGKNMRNGGSVVLISSAAAKIGLANHEAIAAAKAGIIGLVKSAAATYATNNLRFNAIAPGLVETPLSENIIANPMARKVSEGFHALGRFGTADDIGRAIAFLLAPENNWITGQVFDIDGGLGNLQPRPKVN